MSQPRTGVILLEARIEVAELRRLIAEHFEDMVKYVVDVQRRVIAIGGDLHADAEALLLEHGSEQHDLWSPNYYPGQGPQGCIEYTSLINIRPSQQNRSMEIQDDALRRQVCEITFELIGRGEEI